MKRLLVVKAWSKFGFPGLEMCVFISPRPTKEYMA
jgi:hypothetical protein